MGGSGEKDNLAVYCRKHNQLSAEKTFGRKTIASHSAAPRQRGEPDGAALALGALVKMGFKPGRPGKLARRANKEPNGVPLGRSGTPIRDYEVWVTSRRS